MDETDLILSKMLLFNSRTPYRALADALGLSVNAVHKRIQSMVEAEVIRGFTAKVSLIPLGAYHVFLHGRSEAESTYSIMEGLGGHDSVYWVTLAGGNYVYVGAHLREIQDLPSVIEYVERAGRMPDLTVDIVHEAFSGKGRPIEELIHPIDWEILASMRYDSRKPVSKIAEEVGVSSRTVRRRLARLVDEGIVDFSIAWYPSESSDINTVIHLDVDPSSAQGVVDMFMAEYQPNALFAWRFVNQPGKVIAFLWAPSMNRLRELTERMGGDEAFSSSTPTVLYAGSLYETWRDRLVEEHAPPKG
jgi:DNA-binding Lrp family transcriptional regulator